MILAASALNPVHLLIKSNNINKLRQVIDHVILHSTKAPRGVKVIIDVDPINML